MKTCKLINLLKKMNSKSTLKNFLKFSLGIGLFIPLLKSQPSNAATPCPANDSVTTMSGQANPCFTTPEKLEVTFFEIGFCSSDPLSTGTFDDSTCSKTWDNTSGYKTDIGKKTFEDMVGNVYKVPNATYSHAYAIMNNTWTYKAKYKLKDGDTYYTLSNGAQTTNASQYVDWTDDISDMVGEETTGLCYDYSMSTDNGTVTAVLADSNRVSATNTTFTVAVDISNFLSVQVPEVADVNVSSITKLPVTDFTLNKPLSLSKLTIVPEAPPAPETVSPAINVPVTPVTIMLLKKPKTGGVGDVS